MEGMESSFLCFGVEVGRNGMDRREHLFLSILLRQFSFHSKLGGMGGNGIMFNEFFTKTLKIPLYI